MFEVSPISSHTGTQPPMPVVDCLVTDMSHTAADQTMQQLCATSDQQH